MPWRPSDICVADGHGGNTNDRIVTFANGKFITAWGKHGKAACEFDTPHSIARDSAGRGGASLHNLRKWTNIGQLKNGS